MHACRPCTVHACTPRMPPPSRSQATSFRTRTSLYGALSRGRLNAPHHWSYSPRSPHPAHVQLPPTATVPQPLRANHLFRSLHTRVPAAPPRCCYESACLNQSLPAHLQPTHVTFLLHPRAWAAPPPARMARPLGTNHPLHLRLLHPKAWAAPPRRCHMSARPAPFITHPCPTTAPAGCRPRHRAAVCAQGLERGGGCTRRLQAGLRGGGLRGGGGQGGGGAGRAHGRDAGGVVVVVVGHVC